MLYLRNSHVNFEFSGERRPQARHSDAGLVISDPAGVTAIMESHDEFRRAGDILPVMEGAISKNVAFLWDAHHTCVEAEKPADFYRQLGRYTKHVHLKDSLPIPGKPKEDRRYVLTGTGEIPVKETVRVLATNGYKARTMRQYLAEADVNA